MKIVSFRFSEPASTPNPTSTTPVERPKSYSFCSRLSTPIDLSDDQRCQSDGNFFSLKLLRLPSTEQLLSAASVVSSAQVPEPIADLDLAGESDSEPPSVLLSAIKTQDIGTSQLCQSSVEDIQTELSAAPAASSMQAPEPIADLDPAESDAETPSVLLSAITQDIGTSRLCQSPVEGIPTTKSFLYPQYCELNQQYYKLMAKCQELEAQLYPSKTTIYTEFEIQFREKIEQLRASRWESSPTEPQ